MRDLLLVGRDLKELLPHSFELGDHFSTTTLTVNEARPREERRSGGGSRGGYSGGQNRW